MAKINLYIPDDLKARMDAAADAINWSEVARPAFTAALAAYEHRKERNMDTAIERLRASKHEAEQADKTDGRSDGRDWAQDFAEYPVLKRLYATDPFQIDHDEGAVFKALWGAVGPEMDKGEAWEYCFGSQDAEHSDEYILAFIEGAQEFFSEVSRKL